MKTCCTPGRPTNGATAIKPPAHGNTHAGRALVTLPGGTFLMGTDHVAAFPADGEGPVRPVSLSAFEIDTFPVTNGDFAAFVEASGYVTDSERYGWSFVFQGQIPPEAYEALVADTLAAAPWWCMVHGANWRSPEGPGSDIAERANHPVVHVSWNDASAFSAWYGWQLPSEAQWEYAARGGLEQKIYAWGDDLTPDGQHMCNIWQGTFPTHNSLDDGFAATCPVDAFAPNGYGLYSMAGNTWEWCSDFWGTQFAAKAAHNPKGADFNTSRVMKGGSFLCHASYCNRYRVSARTHNTPDSAASNIGFRCVRPIAA